MAKIFDYYFVAVILCCCKQYAHSDILEAKNTAPAIFNGEEWVPVNVDKKVELRPPPPTSDNWKSTTTEIFIAIAHYRDSRCGITLMNYFSKAKYPDRLRIGIIEQRLDDEDDCIETYCRLMKSSGKSDPKCPHINQIKSIFYTKLDARGPTFGRYLQQTLLEDEEFCLQTDSHMDVVKDWDVEMLTMWGSIQNEYAVLSTYVTDLNNLGQNINNQNEVPHLCRTMWTDRGMVRNHQAKAAVNLPQPILAPFWAAGFSFSKCHLEHKVPNDGGLPRIFDGEEFSKFARMWTRGYDVYTPHRNIIAHDYTGKMYKSGAEKRDPTEWTKNGMTEDWKRMQFDESLKRLFTLLGMPGGSTTLQSVEELTKYGLGRKRTLDQLIAFTGIDLRNRILFENRCKDLDWVPFTPDQDPWVDTEDIWGMGPEVLLAGGQNIPLLSGQHQVYIAPTGEANGTFLPPHKLAKHVDYTTTTTTTTTATNILGNTDASELWFGFQFIDQLVEMLIVAASSSSSTSSGGGGTSGPNTQQGLQIVELLLLASPILLGILFVAFCVLTASGSSMTGDIKRV